MFSITTPSQGKYSDAIRAICPYKINNILLINHFTKNYNYKKIIGSNDYIY